VCSRDRDAIMHNHRPALYAALCLALLAVAHQSAAAQEWTRFRGPNGSGVSPAMHVPAEWDADDVNWRVKLPGVGHSSPVLWGKKIFLTTGDEESGSRTTLCLHADDGRTLWSRTTKSKAHGKHSLNSFASSSPAVDGDRVYLLWTTPEEYAVEALDHAGEPVWRKVIGPYQSGHGSGVSPILHDGMVIIANDHEGDSSLVALDCRTGEIRWRTPRKTKTAYATPCVYQPKGGPAQLIFTSWISGISSIDPADGSVNWELLVFDEKHSETSIGSPIVVGDYVLGTCGYLGYATHTVAVRSDASLPEKAKVVYRVDRGAPLTTTPVAAGGLLFLWDDAGIVTCTSAETGEQHWRNRVGGTYYGSPVVVNGRVYCMSAQGEAVVLAADKEYRLLARNPLGEGSHATPAVAGGVMYLRTFSHLISLGGER
jgi:outer membrane protein assembly factor BamB